MRLSAYLKLRDVALRVADDITYGDDGGLDDAQRWVLTAISDAFEAFAVALDDNDDDDDDDDDLAEFYDAALDDDLNARGAHDVV